MKTVKRIFSLCLVITIVVSAFGCFATSASATTIYKVGVDVKYGQTEARTIVDMINEMRTGDDAWYWNSDGTTKTVCDNLSPLEYDYSLEKIAMQRAVEIALSFSHTRPDSTNCFDIYSEMGYSLSCMGENIAAGQTTATSANNSWREDNDNYSGQGHRRNMLNSKYNAIGIGHVYYNGTHYWVEEFGYTKSVDTTQTDAVDTVQRASVNVSQDNISSVALNDVEPLNVQIKESTDLPEITAKLTMPEHWGSAYCPVVLQCEYSVEDTSIATIADNEIYGNAVGDTTLNISALGETTQCNVNVSCTHNYVCTESIEPNCTDDGKKVYTCDICDNSYEENISALGHSYSSEVTKEPTYTETGLKTYTCAVCGDSYTEEIPVLEKPIIGVYGNVNGDDVIDVKDVTTIQKHIASIKELTGNNCILADTDKDGNVDINDATNIQRYLAKTGSYGYVDTPAKAP
jgi:uncharacterized protein YkwD